MLDFVSKDSFTSELYDTSDVSIEIALPTRRKAVITVRAQSPLNFVKTYLALKEYVEEMEAQLNIMDEAEGEH